MDNPIKLFLCGDVMTGRGIDQILPYPADPRIYESYLKSSTQYVLIAERENGPIPDNVSFNYIWGDALEVWKKEDPALKIINLETSITDHGEPWPGKGINYKMGPDNTPVLSKAGIDFCALANNHTLDWGIEGFKETLHALDKAGITYAGGGTNQMEASKPAVFPINSGNRILVFSFGMASSGIPSKWAASQIKAGINLLPDLSSGTVEMVRKQIQEINQPGDIVIFSIHWGGNWGYEIPENQKDFAHQLIDQAGVDMVHGHSSHHPKGMEVYKEKLIIYGAGDFISDYEGIRGKEEYRDDLTLMYFPKIIPGNGNLVQLKLVPMQIKNFQLHHASYDDTKWLQNILNREGKKLGTSIQINKDNSFEPKW